ncbi:MAG: TonB-dependent receptor, partial [Nitrospina sp.]|nr:TonB-dependent receptor [Nitrospina sp.]
MHKIILIIVLNFSILTTNVISTSADETEDLKEIKVTSSRNTLTEEDFPGSITVFTAEEIKKKQHQTVADLLRGELGLDVRRNGSFGAQTSIFIRGQGSSSTVVFIDGVPSNANTTGAFDFGDLTLDN